MNGIYIDVFSGISYYKSLEKTLYSVENVHKFVYNGFDEIFLAGLSMGADGGIGSTYNFMADKFVKIKTLFEVGKIDEAKETQKEANKL